MVRNALEKVKISLLVNIGKFQVGKNKNYSFAVYEIKMMYPLQHFT